MCKSKDCDHSIYETVESYGWHLGYPDCCVEEFAATFEPARVRYPNGFKLFGTGFVPCQRCNADKTHEQLIAEIQANRKCSTPFMLV